jgi:hypothetical protein
MCGPDGLIGHFDGKHSGNPKLRRDRGLLACRTPPPGCNASYVGSPAPSQAAPSLRLARLARVAGTGPDETLSVIGISCHWLSTGLSLTATCKPRFEREKVNPGGLALGFLHVGRRESRSVED